MGNRHDERRWKEIKAELGKLARSEKEYRRL